MRRMYPATRRKLIVLTTALLLVLGLASCDYSLGKKEAGVRYSMDYGGCRFSYIFYQDGWNGVAEVADFSHHPGTHTCRIWVQVLTHNSGRVDGGPIAGPVEFGALRSPPASLRSTRQDGVFGIKVWLEAWQPVSPERKSFSHTFTGTVFG